MKISEKLNKYGQAKFEKVWVGGIPCRMHLEAIDAKKEIEILKNKLRQQGVKAMTGQELLLLKQRKFLFRPADETVVHCRLRPHYQKPKISKVNDPGKANGGENFFDNFQTGFRDF